MTDNPSTIGLGKGWRLLGQESEKSDRFGRDERIAD